MRGGDGAYIVDRERNHLVIRPLGSGALAEIGSMQEADYSTQTTSMHPSDS
jgi:hypothetical protein